VSGCVSSTRRCQVDDAESAVQWCLELVRTKGTRKAKPPCGRYSQEDKIDDVKDSFYKELERVFNEFPKYHMNVLLGDFNAKTGRKDIFKQRVGNERFWGGRYRWVRVDTSPTSLIYSLVDFN
jgi:hypothetical protein